MVRNVKITSEGIKSVLRRLKFSQKSFYKSIAEYIWNGFDADASTVEIFYKFQGGILKNFRIKDNGYGIDHEDLKDKFDPFFESEKLINGGVDRHSSTFHGRNGVGRLTFFTFANFVRWKTIFKKNGKKWQYEIDISASKLESYSGLNSKPEETSKNTGSEVIFDGINKKIHEYFNEQEFMSFLMKEFCWFLELNKGQGYRLLINGVDFDYSAIVEDQETFQIIHKESGEEFSVRYLRWQEKTNDEYSKFYYLTNKEREKYKENTTLNNQGDHFYHSVYVSSKYFNDFNFSIKEGSEQKSLVGGSKSDPAFQYLMEEVYQFLRRKRKPFLKEYSKKLVEKFEEEKIIVVDKKSQFELAHVRELKEVIKGLYETQPKIFSGLKNIEQKKTLVGFLKLLLDSDEREKILEILEQIVKLDENEREELRQLLKVTKLSRIIQTINLVKDRFIVINQLKQILFDKELKANEIDHLQKAVEPNTWIFGEQYTLIAAAEDDFEKALRAHIHLLEDKDLKIKIDHPDKKKQVDIFICRQEERQGHVHNVIVELKHPQKNLGESNLSQVKRYLRTILQIPRFNANNYTWEFILVGTKFDTTGYIEGEIENNKKKGEDGLVYHLNNYKVYVKKWSDILIDCNLRHKFIDKKLQLDKDKIAKQAKTADEAVENATNNSAAEKISK
ncbi:hypothetical protein HOC32_00450 [Candidatus Woesearchaeota archaeon]|nr:hypothetical protein [Candidatus Woesearchaeota archaeon]